MTIDNNKNIMDVGKDMVWKKSVLSFAFTSKTNDIIDMDDSVATENNNTSAISIAFLCL